jgi:hypothetical protein
MCFSGFNPLTLNGLYSGRAVRPLNSQMAYKVVANSVLKFGGILFTPIQLSAVVCYASQLWKVRLSFRSQNLLPPPPKPLHKHRYTRRHLVTAHFSLLTNTVLTVCFDYPWLCSALWVEISTLAYETNTLSYPGRLLVAYCTHIIQTKRILKNRRYPDKSMCTATGGSTDLPLVMLG